MVMMTCTKRLPDKSRASAPRKCLQFSFVYDVKGRLGGNRPRPVGSKDSLLLDERYEQRVLLEDDFHHLLYTAHLGYPVESIDGRDCTIPKQ